MPPTDPRRATCYGLAAVTLWSTVATAFKLTLRHLAPVQLLLWASVTSTLFLLGLLAARGKLGQLWPEQKTSILRAAALGLINPTLYYIILFEAYARLPAQLAQPLNYTWAITLSLLAVPLLGQRLGGRVLAGLLVSYAGVVVLCTGGTITTLEVDSPLGVGLALGSTVLWALYWIGNTKRTSSVDPVAGLCLGFLFSLPATATVAWIWTGLAWPSWPGLAGAVYVGLFEMGLTFVLWLKALRLAPSAARVSHLIFFSPFLSLVFIGFVLGEAISPATPVGLLFIVAGVLVQGVKDRPS